MEIRRDDVNVWVSGALRDTEGAGVFMPLLPVYLGIPLRTHGLVGVLAERSGWMCSRVGIRGLTGFAINTAINQPLKGGYTSFRIVTSGWATKNRGGCESIKFSCG